MRRILFRCFGRPIHSYTAMLYLGIVLGTYAQLFAATRLGLDPGRVLAATVVLIGAALFGARLLHVAPHWRRYLRNPARIFAFTDGGASLYGGLLSVPASALLLPLFDLPFGAYWDTAVFNMLTGMVVGRAGCFLNGCCAGRETAGWLGLHLPDDHGVCRRRIPTQILEALWSLVALTATALLWRRLPFDGAGFLFGLGCYGFGRLALEPLRESCDRMAGLRLHQALSALFLLIAGSGLAVALLPLH